MGNKGIGRVGIMGLLVLAALLCMPAANASGQAAAPSGWHSLDRPIDKALHDARRGKSSQAACQESPGALLKLFDQLSGNS